MLQKRLNIYIIRRVVECNVFYTNQHIETNSFRTKMYITKLAQS